MDVEDSPIFITPDRSTPPRWQPVGLPPASGVDVGTVAIDQRGQAWRIAEESPARWRTVATLSASEHTARMQQVEEWEAHQPGPPRRWRLLMPWLLAAATAAAMLVLTVSGVFTLPGVAADGPAFDTALHVVAQACIWLGAILVAPLVVYGAAGFALVTVPSRPVGTPPAMQRPFLESVVVLDDDTADEAQRRAHQAEIS